MKPQFFYRFSCAIVTLVFLLTTTGCAGNVPATASEPTSSPAPAASAVPSAGSADATSTAVVPVSDPNILYQDDFTNPATGWSEDKFDNYFIGYHEPEYYHIEITSPNYKTTVFEPEKKSFGDATLELQVQTVASKTAAVGDFRYGLAFRRSGDQYYALTISPRTKQWYVLKSSPNELAVLAQGTEESIHNNLDAADALRVDARGADLFFHINDHLVGQVTDPDYAQGEAGFYVETLDAANVHIHFDSLLIREVEISLLCAIHADTLYVRGGPGKAYTPIAVLSAGDTVEPAGKSLDGQWAKIAVKGIEKPGWVFISEAFMACNGPIDALPAVNP